MYTIELNLKGNPAPISVQIKEEQVASQHYERLTQALQAGMPKVLELSCDRTQKKVMVLTSEVVGVQLTPKVGSSSPVGSRPGFSVESNT